MGNEKKPQDMHALSDSACKEKRPIVACPECGKDMQHENCENMDRDLCEKFVCECGVETIPRVVDYDGY